MPTIILESITTNGTHFSLNFDNGGQGILNSDAGASYTSFEMGQNFLQAVWNNSRLVDQSVYSGVFDSFVAEAAPEFLFDGSRCEDWME